MAVRRIPRNARALISARSPASASRPGPGIGPRHAAHEPLPSGFHDLGHRVVAGNGLQPPAQQSERRVGGRGQDQEQHPCLHERRPGLGLEPQRDRRAPACGDRAHAHDEEQRDREPAEPGPVDAQGEAHGQQHGCRDQRAQARRQNQSGEQDGTRRGGEEEAVEPPLLDVPCEVHAGGGAREPRSLQEADRNQEALIAARREARKQGQVAEHGEQAEKEDGGRQHARDRRAGDAQQLVRRASRERSNCPRVGVPIHGSAAGPQPSA